MKIAILSDSHDDNSIIKKVVRSIGKNPVDYLLHAGDITAARSAQSLASINSTKLIAVFGNCDFDTQAIKYAVETNGGTIYDNIFAGSLDGRHVFMKHKPQLPQSILTTNNYDLIVFGHTHISQINRLNGTLIVNPGGSSLVYVNLDDMNIEAIEYF